MPLKTLTDFWEISRHWASVRFPAPGTSRSITNLGMGIPLTCTNASMHVEPLQDGLARKLPRSAKLPTSITIPANETINGRPETITQDKFLDLGAYYDSANNFGRGSYSPRSSSASTDTGGEFFEIRYRIDVREI